MGYPYTYSEDDSENTTDILTPLSVTENGKSIGLLIDFISEWKLQRYSESKALICGLNAESLKSNISLDSDGCSVIGYEEFLTLLNSIKIHTNPDAGEEEPARYIEYQTGRKDFILGRMLEDDYISFDDYKQALITSIGYEFNSYSENIKYPHFVFYVREYLEEKYGQEILESGGLHIYTTINPALQDKAQEIVETQAASNETRF